MIGGRQRRPLADPGGQDSPRCPGMRASERTSGYVGRHWRVPEGGHGRPRRRRPGRSIAKSGAIPGRGEFGELSSTTQDPEESQEHGPRGGGAGGDSGGAAGEAHTHTANAP